MSYYGMIRPPHLKRNELAHGRPKNSRNGFTTMDNYIPKGKPAEGRLINGRYVYDDRNRINTGLFRAPSNSNNLTRAQIIANGPKTDYQTRQREQLADNYRRAMSQPVQQAPDNRNFLQRAGGAIGDAANTVASYYGNAAKNAGKAISGWAGGLADNVGKAASGAGQFIGDRWNDLGSAANKWGGGLARTASGAVRKAKDVGTNVGNWLSDRGRDAGQAIGNTVNMYKNGAKELGNAFADYYGPKISKAGEAISGAYDAFKTHAQTKGKAAVDAIGGAAKGAADAVGTFVTGGDLKERAARERKLAEQERALSGQLFDTSRGIADKNGNSKLSNDIYDNAVQAYLRGGKADRAADYLDATYNKTIPGMADKAYGALTAREQKQEMDAANSAFEQAQKDLDRAREQYDKKFWERGRSDNDPELRRLASELGDAEMRWLKAKDRAEKATNAYNNTFASKVNTAGNNVKDFATTTIGNIKDAGEGALNNASEFIGNMFRRKDKK